MTQIDRMILTRNVLLIRKQPEYTASYSMTQKHKLVLVACVTTPVTVDRGHVGEHAAAKEATIMMRADHIEHFLDQP